MAVEDLIGVVARAAREVGEREGTRLPAELTPDTALFGEGGLFDSLGLVSLILAVEEAILEQYDVAVTLADERAMSEARSPFRTVRTLAEYAGRRLERPVADT